jgi:hypothetical protein
VTTYTDVFSAGSIQPSDVSYAAYTSTTSLTLNWPTETAPNNNIVAVINDVSFGATGLSITLPDATQVSVGANPIWNNVGANSFTLLTSTGGTIFTATSGAVWVSYLADNSTAGGTWRSFQAGAGTSAVAAGSLAGLGITAITTTLNQEYDVATATTAFTATDRASTRVWTGGAGTITATTAASLGNGWFVNVKNLGTGALIFDPSAGETVDDQTTFTFNPGDSGIINTDGSEFYVLGFGQDAAFAFDYTEINVAGSGNYTLSGTELNRIAYKFTGALTGARDIIVPSTVQQYWVDNSTTGSFTFGVRTAAQTSPGVAINNGSTRQILYCNGTNVVLADTAGLSSPITIAQGGTGATTASGARSNLDVPSVNDSILYAIAVG